ncbi:MAG: hypothetical protein JWN76_2014, partial [Chitinophagaceae bacterium]|nr:hypothetical protein [Chitinophagaceae bacterium]
KTGYQTTPLKPEKRLTGDLSKIISPASVLTDAEKKDNNLLLRKAISILEDLKMQRITDLTELRQASEQLAIKATGLPLLYVNALQSLRKILNSTTGNYSQNDIAIVQQALQRILLSPSQQPAQQNNFDPSILSGRYFLNLQKNKRP